MGGVAKVIGVKSFGQGGAGGGFDSDNVHVPLAPQLGSQKWKAMPAKLLPPPVQPAIVSKLPLLLGDSARILRPDSVS